MKLIGVATLIASLTLAGCSGSNQTVEVRITADSYRTGSVNSKLATPVVDEVVRINPKRVLMVTCLSTPPAKVIQFVDEVRARIKPQIQGTFAEQDCPA